MTVLLTAGLVTIDRHLHNPQLAVILHLASGLEADRYVKDGHLLPIRGVTETGKQLQCLVLHHDKLGKAMHTEKIVIAFGTLLIGESLHAMRYKLLYGLVPRGKHKVICFPQTVGKSITVQHALECAQTIVFKILSRGR
jgi:hypothetical protein